MNWRCRQRAFSLVETLVAVLVLAVGLLGLAGLQVTGLKSNHGSYLRSQATALAYDLIERMRANRAAVANGDYDNPAPSRSDACLSPPGCSPSALARHDLYEWAANLAELLPQGEGVVCIDSSPDDGTGSASPACDGVGERYVVKIWWNDRLTPHEPQDSERMAFHVSFQP